MTIVTRRAVTPLFAHDTGGAILQHHGTHRDVEFTVTLQPDLHAPDDFNEITRYASPGVRRMLVEHRMVFSERMGGLASHMLIVDVWYDDGGNEAPFRFDEALQVEEAAISSIRLASSAGVWSERTF